MLTRKILIEKRFIILPVERGPTPSPSVLSPDGPWPERNNSTLRNMGHLRIKLNGKILYWFDIKLVSNSGDYQVFTDLEKYLGKVLDIEYEGSTTHTLDGIFLSDAPPS